MERSESFKYHSQEVVKIPAKSQNPRTTGMSSATVPSPEDQSESTGKEREAESVKAGAGKRRSLEGRVVRGTKAPDIPIFERKNWLIHLHYVRKDFEACKVLAKELMAETDDMCEYAVYIMGLVLRHEGDLQGSLELFQRAVHLNPNNPANVKQAARSQFLLGKHKVAMETYAEASALSPNDWEVLHNQGVCSVYLKQYDKAVEYFQQALEQSPQLVTYKQLGHVHLLNKSLEDALSVYKQAVKWSPEDADLLTTLGLLYLQLGQTPRAFEALGNALTFSPMHGPAVLAVGSMMQEHGDYDVALSKYRVAAQSLPESPQLWNNIGMCNFSKKRYIASISCLKRATYLDPLEWRVLYNLGLLHLTTQQFASAFYFLRAAASFKSKSGCLYMLIAIALTKLNDAEHADLMYRKAVNLDKSDPLICLNYGIFLYNQDRVSAAADMYRQYMSHVKALGPASLDPEMLDMGEKMKQMTSLNTELLKSSGPSLNNQEP